MKTKYSYIELNKILGTNFKSNNELDKSFVTKNLELTDDNIKKFSTFIDWYELSHCRDLSEDFIEKYHEKLNLNVVCIYQKLSEKFIERHKHRMNWSQISVYQKLSEKFIEKYANLLDLLSVCKFQKLSDNFILKYFKDLMPYLFEIAKYQNISEKVFNEIEKYAKKNKGYLLLSYLYSYNKTGKRKLFKLRLKSAFNSIFGSFNYLSILNDIENSWLYVTTQEKKKVIVDTGRYECHDDYFIAYKAVKPNRYSMYNFQYKYEKGGIYESKCDYTPSDCSFGLSAGTLDYSTDYGGSENLIIKCKIRYEDVGRVIHDGRKIRCCKLEVLN